MGTRSAADSRNDFDLYLFYLEPSITQEALSAGVSTLVVDWENRGKVDRQRGADTQINYHTTVQLIEARRFRDARIMCRINPFETRLSAEIEEAIENGSDEVFLPMVRTPDEVEKTLQLVSDRCDVGILIETIDALENLKQLAQLPISRCYVGLNDLAIERHSSNIFAPLADGTLDNIRSFFKVPFGFGGLTLPDRGSPIPCRLLIAEMIRLECQFSFLRRSFHADIVDRSVSHEVPRILEALALARKRDGQAIVNDKHDLLRAISTLNK